MSHDVKYIGMYVHKEAIVAVPSSTGKLVMESVIETKASSILQFIHSLRGELHVTWEEGTWAAWLYDLLQPQLFVESCLLVVTLTTVWAWRYRLRKDREERALKIGRYRVFEGGTASD
jgi:hypothetical protein